MKDKLTRDNEQELKRIGFVKSLEVLDSPNEPDFDDLVNLAAMIFDVPISTVTILDSHRQWFKAAVGLTLKETTRQISFCTHAIEQSEPLIVSDAAHDLRFADNPLVVNEPKVAFYAGVPLRTSDDIALGTFCIMDKKPRELSKQEVQILKVLANQAMKLLELRSERNKYRDLVLEKELINKQLDDSNTRWQFALEGAGDAIWDWDIEHNHCFFSKSWGRMLGYADDELSSSYKTWLSLIHKDDLPKVEENLNDYLSKKADEYQVEFRMLCKDLSYKWVLTRGMAVDWDELGQPKRMLGTHTDISNRKKNEEIIWKQANFDALTGLPNRRMFFDRLNEEIKRCDRAKTMFALMYIDLDGFKKVNDSFGHLVGDNLLVQVAQRVSQCIRESDTVARLGGDEFTIILRDIENSDAVRGVAEKLLSDINTPFKLGVYDAVISASIGISIFPNNSIYEDMLINIADKAMYEAKANGKNCWVIKSEII